MVVAAKAVAATAATVAVRIGIVATAVIPSICLLFWLPPIRAWLLLLLLPPFICRWSLPATIVVVVIVAGPTGLLPIPVIVIYSARGGGGGSGGSGSGAGGRLMAVPLQRSCFCCL